MEHRAVGGADPEELVLEPFQRLVDSNELVAHDYDGFWLPMDTAKDKKRLDDLYETGVPPWQLWKNADTSPVTLPDDWRTPTTLRIHPTMAVGA